MIASGMRLGCWILFAILAGAGAAQLLGVPPLYGILGGLGGLAIGILERRGRGGGSVSW